MSKKKIVIGAVVVLGAAYVGSSWYVGSKTETVIAAQLVKANEKLAQQTAGSGDSVRLEQVSYERGVFSSSAVYALKINMNGKDAEMRFSDHYSHGPFPGAALADGVFSPMLSYSQSQLLNEADGAEWYKVTNGEVPVKATSQVKLGGDVKSHVVFAPIKVESKKGVLLETSLANLYLDVGKNYSYTNSVGDLAWIGISEAAKGERMLFSEVTLEGASTDKGDVVSSTYKGAVKRTEYSSTAEGVVVVLDGLHFDGEGTQTGTMLDHATVNYGLNKLLINDGDYGSFDLGFALKNIDVKTLQELGEVSEELEDNPEVAETYLLRLLESKPEITIKPAAWKNTGGESVVNAQVALQPAVDEEDPLAAVNSLTIDASFSRSMVSAIFGSEEGFMRSMIDMAFDEGSKEYANMGLVSYDGKTTKLDLKYNSTDGTVVLNGKTMSFEEFFMLLMESGLGNLLM
ncbi:YdgA family protein [Paenalcaligenes suwonensis]|uniref:YdgA family protein n=1 Tax=Paenalcaligenes suwonensis TaxID=1202713 RepID=UPI0014099CA2|nr:YdgA family protein [Paenalcaligenes suwonensis]NHC61231.1 YdgA family protein [Paenalcaligenes suwonensis]